METDDKQLKPADSFRIYICIILLCLFFASGTSARPPGYFQQELKYKIKVDLDPGSAKLAGAEKISYKNNSPDTLNEIYFHLYYNAFRPGSYLDLREREAGYHGISELPGKGTGYVNIDLIKIDGKETEDYSIDNTIMKVALDAPLAPQGDCEIYIEFTSQVPKDGSRTAHSDKHFDIGQWYPKPAVYDRYGWHIPQYLDYEFYADYADFNVELTIPSEYIVAHMGTLVNEEEIYGDKLTVPTGDTIIIDILAGYGEKEEDSSKSEVSETGLTITAESVENIEPSLSTDDTIGVDDDLKTWEFTAKNVHDFAFCADPGFIVDICRYNDTVIKTYYTKYTKERWERKAADYTRKAIKYYSERYYPYPYKQYSTVASLTGGGMEYPQLTMVSRRAGSRGKQTNRFESLIAHEVAHAWFYGILGFNETEQSFLDEGLTTFATIEYMEHYYGRTANNFKYEKKWQKRLLPNGNERNDEQKRYIMRAILKNEDPMNTPANLFIKGRYYNASYQKASSVYIMLRYVLGDDNFNALIRKMFYRWGFKHPYLSDFQSIAEEIYKDDLRWFFRQWFTTTWRLDYSLDKMKSRRAEVDGKTGYETTVSIGKKERCISPLDIVFYYNDQPPDTLLISQDIWMDGLTKYDTTMFLVAKPKKAVINPGLELADINMLNNNSGLPNVRWQFMVPRLFYKDSYVEHYFESYTVAHKPLVWYNSKDGAKVGYRFDGSYLGVTKKIRLESWIGLSSGKFNYTAEYNTPLMNVNPKLEYYLKSSEIEGRGKQMAGLFWSRSRYRINVSLQRYFVFEPKYIYGDSWSPGDINTMEVGLDRDFRFKYSKLGFNVSAVSSVWGSDYDFSRVSAKAVFELKDALGGGARLKVLAGVSNGNVPIEKQFFLSSANPIEIWGSPLYRSKGTLPDDWKDDNRLFKPGGGGLYGYYDRGLTGKKILSFKLERDLPGVRLPVEIPFFSRQLRRISPQVYVGSGFVWNQSNDFNLNDFLSEAGLTFKYKIPYLNYIFRESRINLFLPLWISNPYDGESSFDFRWLVGFTT